MGTIAVADILRRAGNILNDAGFTRWTEDELIDWFNDAQRAVVAVRPDAYAIAATRHCAVGARQTIPENGLRFIKATRNVGGRAITPISGDLLDSMNPEWAATEPGTSAQHYIFDARVPREFYLYPPVVASHEIELVYAKTPRNITITTGSEVMELDDAYQPAVLDFMCYRAFQKDSEVPASAQRSANHLQAFLQMLGAQTQSELAVSS